MAYNPEFMKEAIRIAVANVEKGTGGPFGASVRMDGSDLFGVDKKYRFLPIYSVSGLWRISNEPFMESSKNWIDNLALRLSYGLQGNIDKNTSPYLVGNYGNQTILPGNTESSISISGAPND